MNKKFNLVTFILLVGLLSLTAFAQLEQGQISGTVTDPQGAVVPGAKVTVTNIGTGQSRSVTTDAAGRYNVTNLQPAEYDVKAEGTGFQPFTRRARVSVGGRLTNDIQFGAVASGEATVIDVVGEAGVAVNVTNQELGQTINSQQITQVPTLTRNAYSLVGLAGNVSEDPSATGRGAGYSINGQRVASTSILLDGGENVDLFGAAVGQDVPLDSVSEFRVITNNFNAEYGRAAGGVVNVATKSGTNNFHGSVYEFNRISTFAANTFDHVVNDIDKDRFTRNQFGYAVGGPIIKNKLFFFSSTEWIRVRSQSTSQAYIAAPQFISAANANTTAFYNTFGAVGTSTNVVSTVNNNAAEMGALGLAPVAGYGTGPVLNLVTYTVPSNAGGGLPRNEYQMNHKVDFNLTDRTNMYVRFARQNQNFFEGANAESPYAGYNTGLTNINDNGQISLTHIFGPTLASSSKFIYNRLNNLQPLGANPEGPTLYLSGTVPIDFNGILFAGPGYLPYSPGSAIPFGGPQNLYQFYQDLSWTKGAHQLKFGGNYIHTRDNRVFGAFQNSVISLSVGADPDQALDFLFTGQQEQFQAAIFPQGKFPCPTNAANVVQSSPACQISTPVGPPSFGRNNRYHDWAVYGQDSWKVTPRLTLNYGLRYEYYGVQHNANPALDSNFYLGSGSTLFEQIRNGSVQIANQSPEHGIWAPDKNNFAPRVGFAWDIFGNGKTSFRGGYGISFERNFGNVTFNVIQNPPNYAVISILNTDVGGTLPISTSNVGPLAGSGVTKDLPKTSLRAIKQDLKTAYANFWSGSLERELFRNTVFALEYSGSHGVGLYTIENPNRRGTGIIYGGDTVAVSGADSRLNRQYTNVNARGGGGFSHYHGLNARFQTSNLWNAGLQLTSNYTWSHATDNLSSTFSESSNNFNLGLLDPFNPALDRGDADFDVRHRWTMSAVWELPWGKKSDNPFVRYGLAGFTFAPTFLARTGYPFTIFDCRRQRDACPRLFTTDPQIQSGHISDTPSDPTTPNSFPYLTVSSLPISDPRIQNPIAGRGAIGASCTTPGSGLNGPCLFDPTMVGRNSFRQPGFWNLDLGVYKTFQITERVGVQLRGEFFNIFNHHNQYAQIGGAGIFSASATSIQIDTSKGCVGGQCQGSTDERRNTQLGIKFIF